MTLRVNPLAFGAALQPKNKKPQRWPIQPDQTAMPWFWDDLLLFWPIWEGGGTPRDISDRVTDINDNRFFDAELQGNAAWSPGVAGLGIDIPDSGAGSTIEALVRGTTDVNIDIEGLSELSFFCYVDVASYNGTNAGFWRTTGGTGDDDNGNTFFITNGAGGLWVRIGGTDVIKNSNGLSTGLNAFGLSAKSGDTQTYINGIQDDTSATTFSFPTGLNAPIKHFTHQFDTSENIQGHWFTICLWKRKLSATEMGILGRDPFAPFRPRIEATVPVGVVEAGGGVTVSPNDLSGVTALDAATMTQAHSLSLADAAAVAALDQAGLTVDHVMAAADLAATTALGPAGLTQDFALTPAGMAVATTLDSPAMTQAHVLTAADLAATTALDQTALSGAIVLSVDDLTTQTALDAAGMTQDHVLGPAGLDATTALDQAAFTQAHLFVANDLASQTALDEAGLTQDFVLGADDLAAAAALDQAGLTQAFVLAPSDLDTLTAIDAAGMTQLHDLTPGDVSALTALDAATVSTEGISAAAARTVTVSARGRTVVVSSRDRTTSVPGRTRTIPIDQNG